jgi:hypothetical protein
VEEKSRGARSDDSHANPLLWKLATYEVHHFLLEMWGLSVLLEQQPFRATLCQSQYAQQRKKDMNTFCVDKAQNKLILGLSCSFTS